MCKNEQRLPDGGMMRRFSALRFGLFALALLGAFAMAMPAYETNPSQIEAEVISVRVETASALPEEPAGPLNLPQSRVSVELRIRKCRTYQKQLPQSDSTPLVPESAIPPTRWREVAPAYKSGDHVHFYLPDGVKVHAGQIISAKTPELTRYFPTLRDVQVLP